MRLTIKIYLKHFSSSDQSVVRDALAQKLLVKIYMVRGGQDNRMAKHQPDRAGILQARTQQQTISNLPGDPKVGWKWSRRKIQVGDIDLIFLAKEYSNRVDTVTGTEVLFVKLYPSIVDIILICLNRFRADDL